MQIIRSNATGHDKKPINITINMYLFQILQTTPVTTKNNNNINSVKIGFQNINKTKFFKDTYRKKQPQIQFQRLRKVLIWTFVWLVH